jgi:hypothetical protein
LIRAGNPKAEVCVWHDMLAPNLGATDPYYFVKGGFADSVKYAPADLVVICWILDKADEDLKYFADHKHKVMGAPYFDGENVLDAGRTWLKALAKSPACVGSMYVTWDRNYQDLAVYGDWMQAAMKK